MPDATFAIALLLTLTAHTLARLACLRFPAIPVVLLSVIVLSALLWLLHWPYDQYYPSVQGVFSHLLGYVTVALAIPLASMKFDDLPLKNVSLILLFSTLSGALFPMGLAWLLHLSHPMILAFASRAVTTPIALNIATLIHAPLTLASIIVIVSGLVGAAISPLILKNCDDERAAGLALGLAAHAIGTVQAWQRSVVAGRYAAFGMAVNGILTALWVPMVF